MRTPIGKPVTPTDIQIIRQSSLGCQQKARARIFDGATLFVQTNGKTVREYAYIVYKSLQQHQYQYYLII